MPESRFAIVNDFLGFPMKQITAAINTERLKDSDGGLRHLYWVSKKDRMMDQIKEVKLQIAVIYN